MEMSKTHLDTTSVILNCLRLSTIRNGLSRIHLDKNETGYRTHLDATRLVEGRLRLISIRIELTSTYLDPKELVWGQLSIILDNNGTA